jgi:hypothetical protein
MTMSAIVAQEKFRMPQLSVGRPKVDGPHLVVMHHGHMRRGLVQRVAHNVLARHD